MPLIGFDTIIHTTIMLKICTPLPLMYSIMAFMGIALAGAMAASHAFDTWIDEVSGRLSSSFLFLSFLDTDWSVSIHRSELHHAPWRQRIQ